MIGPMMTLLAHVTPGEVLVLVFAFAAGMAAGAALLVRFLRRASRKS